MVYEPMIKITSSIIPLNSNLVTQYSNWIRSENARVTNHNHYVKYSFMYTGNCPIITFRVSFAFKWSITS